MSLPDTDAVVRVDHRKQLVTIRTTLATLTLTLAGFKTIADFVGASAAGAQAH